jgi:hypothetical protein
LVYDHSSAPPSTPPTPPSPPTPLACAAGALSPTGGFLRVANSTIADAVKYCGGSKQCGGFTTKDSTCDTGGSLIHEVYFKSELGEHNGDPVWHTWKKAGWTPPPPPPRLQVFAKPLADGSRAVAMLNRGAAARDAEITWEMIRLGAPATWKSAKVRDLWQHKELGSVGAGFTVRSLQPHATALLIVTEA